MFIVEDGCMTEINVLVMLRFCFCYWNVFDVNGEGDFIEFLLLLQEDLTYKKNNISVKQRNDNVGKWKIKTNRQCNSLIKCHYYQTKTKAKARL